MSIDLILGQLALFQERLSQASPLAEEEVQNLTEIFQRINTYSLRQEDKAAISNLQGRVAQTPQIKELQRIFLSLLGKSSTGYSSTKEMIAILRKGMENYARVVEQLNTPVRDLV